MKTTKLYTLGLAAALAAVILPACQDDFDAPSLVVPEATMKANTSILELKTEYWNEADNYIDTVKLTASGEHVIIAGRVISSDESGNIFKSLVIQDATSALSMSIDANSLCNTYRVGQEIVIDMTDLYIGKYSGLQQLGFPDYSDRYGWQASRLPLEMFKLHSQLNGLPEPSKIDTLLTTISELNTYTSPELLRKWQGQLIRLNNVYFEGGGELTFSDSDASTSRTLLDDSGNSIVVRNSNYASFQSSVMPEGHGDVVAILSYYNNAWQLLLRSKSDCMNFGNPTLAPGTEENPYTVDEARELVGKNIRGWMKGYIVGAVAPEVTSVEGNNDIEWEAPFTLANTLVIGPTAECRNIAECFVISLPQGSAMREYGNLKDHPELLGRAMEVNGTFDTYMDANGVTNNSGSATEFSIEGVEVPGGDTPDTPGDGTENSPYTVTQVLNGTATGTAWVTGYIVGWIDGMTLSDGARFSVPATANTNILISATQGETDIAKCIPVQLPSGSVRTALNLQNHPDNMGKAVSLNASIEKYFGTTGLKSASEYKLGDGGNTPTPTPGQGGDGTENDPYTISQVNSGAATGTAWVSGYIVGWIDGMTLADGARFTADATVATNLLLADAPGVTDLSQCIPVQLPSGSVRSALNLVNNPGNFGKKVSLNASIENYFGTVGLKSATAYKIDGGSDTPDTPVTPVASIDENFDASTNIPAGWSIKVIEGNKEWYIPTFQGNNYAACTGYKGTAPFDSWLISAPIAAGSLTAKTLSFVTQVNGYGSSTSSLEVYVLNGADPATATKTKLNPTLATAPDSGYSSWAESGTLNLGNVSGTIYIGFRYKATVDPSGNYATWCVDNVVVK
ncbi:MAG: DUF6359 domain-containing protein [Pseudoflavonifractor sp.]|nr:DUF6359 domain-containing protein [Pseudoflavonifractor sp.]